MNISDEYYTPKFIIDKVYNVFGTIDLDPASCKEANEMVLANRYYDLTTDGLQYNWYGKVYLNPPFSKKLVKAFVERLEYFYTIEYIQEAILLLNTQTETKLGQRLLNNYPVCFVNRRLKFYNPYKKGKSNRYSQMIFYLGNNVKLFSEVFSDIGTVLSKVGY